jgi:hypothetical protein
MAQIDGTYLIAAASETGVAVEGETVTAFSGAFLNTVKFGVPKGGRNLTLNEFYRGVRFDLLTRGLPEPQSQDGNQIGDLPFIANHAFDPEVHETHQMPLVVDRIHFKIPLEPRSWRDFTPLFPTGFDPTNSPEYLQVMTAARKVQERWNNVCREFNMGSWMPDNHGKRIANLTEDERWTVVAANVKTLAGQAYAVSGREGNISYNDAGSKGRIPTPSGAQTFERLANQLCGQIDELMREHRDARDAYRKALGQGN